MWWHAGRERDEVHPAAVWSAWPRRHLRRRGAARLLDSPLRVCSPSAALTLRPCFGWLGLGRGVRAWSTKLQQRACDCHASDHECAGDGRELVYHSKAPWVSRAAQPGQGPFPPPGPGCRSRRIGLIGALFPFPARGRGDGVHGGGGWVAWGPPPEREGDGCGRRASHVRVFGYPLGGRSGSVRIAGGGTRSAAGGPGAIGSWGGR